MSSCNSLLELQEQICYVQCGFCTTILLVSVPCSSLLKMVTVRCGHCSGLLSVNMMRASFIPVQLLASVHENEHKEVCHAELERLTKDPPSKEFNKEIPLMVSSDNDDEEEEIIPLNPIINKPPEKRQRAPSAYNRFIKDEIQRLKSIDPNITHKEAFSAASKNWAHFPRIQHQLDGESCSYAYGVRKVDKKPRC
ncbi:Axial regulator yabby [Thalictrum thalictroides]|uniref:Axial regulator yabby n=1 Tax=Thalictrum thalictroides TaxID=46969 RepID=A0A7J6V194_THATH|nr:Axial regulator yabby [Thalictrum thalictroides]